MESCTIAVLQGHFNVVFLQRRAVRFYERFMKEIVDIMPALSPSYPRLSIMGFIGWRLMMMQRIWSVNVMVVRNSHGELTCRLKN